MKRSPRLVRRRGAVLILVLWLLIVLGVLGLAQTAAVRGRLGSAERTQGRVEAYWAARAGVEAARNALADADLTYLAPDDLLLDDPERFRDQEVGRARFSLLVPPGTDDDEPRFGLIDECARIDINHAEEDALNELPAMTPLRADSLLDWRDEDQAVRPEGAEFEYYEGLEHPYSPPDGPFVSLRELRRVHGWEEVWAAADPDPFSRFLDEDERSDTLVDVYDARTLLNSLTVWSGTNDPAPDGEARISLNGPDEQAMRERAGLTSEEARAVAAYVRENSLDSPADLLDVTQPADDGEGRDGAEGQQQSGDARPRVFDLARVGEIVDYFSGGGRGEGDSGQTAEQDAGSAEAAEEDRSAAGDTSERPGLVNLNTGPRDVLLAVPGIDEALAEAVLDRQAKGGFERAGQLVELSGMTEDAFREIYPAVTVTSKRFRVLARGYEPASDARVTIEAVLSKEDDGVRIIYWREF